MRKAEILLCLIHLGVAVRIQRLQNNGIILTNIGETVFYEDNWIVATSIKLPSWGKPIEHVKFCENTLKTISEYSGKQSIDKCNSWEGIFQKLTNGFEEQMSELQVFGNNRKRRALLNVIGKVSKFLFGTMDDVDDEKIYRNLADNDIKNNNSIYYMNKQLTVMKFNFNLIVEPMSKLNEEHENLVHEINNITNKLTNNHLGSVVTENSYHWRE